MIFVGDYFALGLVTILFIFFFDSKVSIRFMSTASKLFLLCLVTTALTALTDILTGQMLIVEGIPLWAHMLVNTLYFVVNIVTTSCIALYLFTKILEHTHDRHCMNNARIGLTVLFTIYMLAVLSNLRSGCLFYFDAQGNYCRGPLNALGYVITVLQMGLVMICYLKNRKNASRPMRRVLIQTFPVVFLCIIIQRFSPEIMLNGFIMAMVDAVLFLTFQGQRQGVHSLTQLNDRHRFFKEVDCRISRRESFQVFLINIKNFGTINQKYGHLFGDELLYQFAFSLERLFRNGMSFHMNGTVFSIILPHINHGFSEKWSSMLLDFLKNGITCMNRHIIVDYVVADYISQNGETNAAEFYEKLEYAAAKAYALKQNYIRYTPDVGAEFIRRQYLQERIRSVDRVHGFEVWYQPIKCLSTGKFCSMEALIRLRESDGTLISPAEFIPLAEQTGLIGPVIWFVLEEVCDLLKNTPELANVSVSLNLPMPQLLESGFVSRFTGIVDKAGIQHRRICLEFTERAILENFQKTMGIMEHLTRDGFRFFLDDFGTGYSNFNCLLQLPFQIIKLDSCLARSACNGVQDYSMVRTLTALFHDMNLTVVAEGAETEEDVQALASQGVDRIQGYALAQPMPAAELIEFYRNNSADSR